MSADSSHPIAEEVYYAAEQYMQNLSESLQEQIQILLEQAHTGKKVDNAILSLISDDNSARIWMRAALFGEDAAKIMRSYEPLSGSTVSVPANSVWVCPQCGFEWHVLRAGRPVPPCPKDYSVLTQKT